jgi:hypothetical protein
MCNKPVHKPRVCRKLINYYDLILVNICPNLHICIIIILQIQKVFEREEVSLK